MADDSGTVLLAYYRDQLEAERARQQSLEQRAQAVVTTSGVLLSLLIALSGDMDVGVLVAIPFGAALLALVVAAILALRLIRPQEHAATNIDRMVATVNNRELWTGDMDAGEAQRQVAIDIAKVLKVAKPNNNGKGAQLRSAVNALVVGVGLLAATLLLGVITASSAEVDQPIPDPSDQTSPSAETSSPPPTPSVEPQATVAGPLFGDPDVIIGSDPGRPVPLFGDPDLELRGRDLDDIARKA
jgi:hypothetical protein